MHCSAILTDTRTVSPVQYPPGQ